MGNASYFGCVTPSPLEDMASEIQGLEIELPHFCDIKYRSIYFIHFLDS